MTPFEKALEGAGWRLEGPVFVHDRYGWMYRGDDKYRMLNSLFNAILSLIKDE